MVTGLWRRGLALVTMRHTTKTKDPAIYITCQWQRISGVNMWYLWYRWVVAIFTISVATASFLAPDRGTKATSESVEPPPPIVYWKWFIYLTNWGYTLVVVHSLFALVLLQTAFIEQLSKPMRNDLEFVDVELSACTTRDTLTSNLDEDRPSDLPCKKSGRIGLIYRLIHAAATDLAMLITTVYWTLVYNPEIHLIDSVNVLVHGCNSLVMVTELMMVRHVSRPSDALPSLVVALVYGAFSGAYHAAGGTDRAGRTYIYPALDWSKSGRALIFCAGCGGGLIVAHLVLMLIQTARKALHRRCYRIRNLTLDTSYQ